MAYIGSKPANKPVVASDLDPTVITGQTALASEPADTDEFLISDAGVLKRLDASLIGGGGKVLQVLTYTDNTVRSTSSSGWQIASNTMGGDITPSATSSKILAIVSTNVSVGTNDGSLTLFRDSTNLGKADWGLDYIHVQGNYRSSCTVLLDSPSSTSALTYQVKIAKHNVAYGGAVTINSETALGRLILLEIGA